MPSSVSDARYPERESADRIGNALESAFALKIRKNELVSAHVCWAQAIFMNAQKEQSTCQIQGLLLLQGVAWAVTGEVVLTAGERPWSFERPRICTRNAICPKPGARLVNIKAP